MSIEREQLLVKKGPFSLHFFRVNYEAVGYVHLGPLVFKAETSEFGTTAAVMSRLSKKRFLSLQVTF
jgi:hypothetical protein